MRKRRCGDGDRRKLFRKGKIYDLLHNPSSTLVSHLYSFFLVYLFVLRFCIDLYLFFSFLFSSCPFFAQVHVGKC